MRLYADLGSWGQVADHIGCPRGTLFNWRERKGLWTRNRGPTAKFKKLLERIDSEQSKRKKTTVRRATTTGKSQHSEGPISTDEAELFVAYRALPLRSRALLGRLIKMAARLPLPAREAAMDAIKDVVVAYENQSLQTLRLNR